MENRKRILLTGLTIALSSQLYWNTIMGSFRISASVILLPFLLMTLVKQTGTIRTCTVTAVMVFLFRGLLLYFSGHFTGEALLFLVPGSVFYFCYGILFRLLIRNKCTVPSGRLLPSFFLCDFASNMLEILLLALIAGHLFSFYGISVLFFTALFRTLAAGLCLLAERQYRTLLARSEHERRYCRLFLMTTGLKNEVYFMRKNSEEIEGIMRNAYRLYETLKNLDLPEETKQTALSIARDVHEIKKDYIRIIQGIEQEISEEYDEKQMEFRDLLKILEETTHHFTEDRGLSVRLDFRCRDNFITDEHYELMAVLKNLVTNSIEAIASGRKKGTVSIEEFRQGDDYVFLVTDDGPGISPRHLPNIFKMGYSTKFDRKTGNISRGVGLCGVRMTVEETFRGTIRVSSQPGQGAVFTVRIPAQSLKGAAE